MKTILNNIAFWTVYGTWYALSLLPMWVHYLFSDFLYLLVAHVVRYRHRVVWKNLKNAYPDKSEQELKRLQRRFYRHFCDILVETVKYATISKRNIMRRMTFKGCEQVAEILNSGQSIALLLGHYGNWEWVTSFALWLPPVERDVILGQLYHPLENAVMNRVVLKMRNRMGPVCVPTTESLRWIIGNKQQGRLTMLGYINDQVPKWENIHYWALVKLNGEWYHCDAQKYFNDYTPKGYFCFMMTDSEIKNAPTDHTFAKDSYPERSTTSVQKYINVYQGKILSGFPYKE